MCAPVKMYFQMQSMQKIANPRKTNYAFNKRFQNISKYQKIKLQKVITIDVVPHKISCSKFSQDLTDH